MNVGTAAVGFIIAIALVISGHDALPPVSPTPVPTPTPEPKIIHKETATFTIPRIGRYRWVWKDAEGRVWANDIVWLEGEDKPRFIAREITR